MMNYFLPLKGIASMHCSANTDMNGENTAVFFGLSGTGKTTLSTDPKRLLIGDDEHGWDDNGVFNFEGGCYAKVINLDKDSEPDIFNAIRRDALLENVTVDKNGKIDFADKSVTENTRVSYPIYHINNIVRPISHGVPITLRAKKEGVTPQDIVDRYHSIIKKSFEDFGISFDIYSRTTSAIHTQVASDFFRTLYDKGEFIEKTSEQYYDEEAKQFLADRYITGTCPHCGNEHEKTSFDCDKKHGSCWNSSQSSSSYTRRVG